MQNPLDKSSPKVGIVSLGCPKALVDSERIITRLRVEGYEISGTYENADIVLVNTCGFLKSAREESLDAIGEAISENGKVIVTGCLGREEQEIRDRHPDVLAVTGPHQYEAVISEIHKTLPPKHNPFLDLVPADGLRLTPRHYAYLKISEGCNNACSFCIIPHLRGALSSRQANEIMYEAEKLAQSGVKELLIISQDTSAYGLDLKYETSRWHDQELRANIQDLAEALGTLGIWIRLHYIYPYPHVDKLIPLMSENKILPYLDIPFQHASPSILKAMRRPAHQEKTLTRIKSWRNICPELAIRSTFIVGFPGETEEDFDLLLNWLEEAEITRVGCFKYEDVKGAKANDLPDAVPEDVKEQRWHRLMQKQQEVSSKILSKKIGSTIEVIIDEVDEEGAIGRSAADAPDIDGNVFLNGETACKQGDIVFVKIDHADHYDLWGSKVQMKVS